MADDEIKIKGKVETEFDPSVEVKKKTEEIITQTKEVSPSQEMATKQSPAEKKAQAPTSAEKEAQAPTPTEKEAQAATPVEKEAQTPTKAEKEVQEPKTGESPNDQRIKDATDKNKVDLSQNAKGKAKDDVKNAENKLAKKGAEKAGGAGLKQKVAQSASAAAKAIGKLIASAASALVDAVGWPVLAVVAAICLIIIIIFALVACSAYGGEFGKTYPQKAGKDSKSVQALLNANKTLATDVTGDKYHRFDFLNAEDKKFTEDGLIDKRLATSLDYLQKLHKRIAVSHIISTYKDMPKNPEADSQLSSNVSAHKDGLAADVTEIDFVYKVWEENKACQALADAITGGGASAAGVQIGDLIFYGDEEPATTDSTGATDTSIDTNAPAQTGENIDMENQQLQDLKNQLEETQNQLKAKLSQTANEDGRQKIQAQILKLQALIGKVDSTITKLNQTKAKLVAFEQKLIEIQNKLAEADNILVGLNNLGNQGSYDEIIKIVGEANKTINTGLSQIDNTLIAIDEVSANATQELSVLQAALNDSSADIDAQFGNLEAQINQFDGLNNLDLFKGLDIALPNLDLFKIALESFVNRVKNEAIETVKEEVKQQINDAIANNLNPALSGIGLGTVGSGELLRLRCEGIKISIGGNTGNVLDAIGLSNPINSVTPNSTFKGKEAEAVPIKVSWQDNKPDVTHTDNSTDESVTLDPRIFYAVYRPQARIKVHQVISELLQMPYDLAPKNISEYRVTQLITFSEDRDVVPFAAILDKLYGKNRPANLGLFSMPESWAQVHIGY